jgi:CBS domain containing-hemolysin-like protein
VLPSSDRPDAETPKAGETFLHGQWQFEVVDLDGQHIDKLLATPVPGLHHGV